MRPLTAEHIRKNSEPHPTASMRGGDARVYREEIGDYILSIVGGGQGLYGDFINSFEVALIDSTTGDFVTGVYSNRGDDVLPYASIDEINSLYYNIPRK
ncbi:MAG: hypothetical protein WCO49_17965 [Nostocales cyanobacterium ELA608]|jgi:hypothetical protein